MIPAVQKLAAKLHAERTKLLAVLATASEAERMALVYEEGWNLYDLLSHLASAEAENARFLAETFGTDGARHVPRESVFSLDEWNARAVAAQRGLSWPERMAALEAARAGTLALLERIDEAGLMHRGTHAVWGEMDLSGLIKILYLHDIMHRNDVARALAAQRA